MRVRPWPGRLELLPDAMRKRKKVFLVILVNLLVFLGLLAGLEGICYLLYRQGGTGARLTAARAFHLTEVRKNMSYDRNVAAYDPEFTYRLKPGTYRFTSQEYDFEYEVNSAGFRDDEASLNAPEIILIGDSYCFGWGIPTGKSFADQLEAALGKKVLNTGIPSLSTSRSLRHLHHIDLRRLKVLILQYCDNDKFENELHYTRQGSVPKLSEARWQDQCNKYLDPKFDYSPGKYLKRFFPLWMTYRREGHTNGVPPFVFVQRDAQHEAGLITYAFVKQAPKLTGVHLIVTELSSYGKNDPDLPLHTQAQMSFHNQKSFGFASITGLDLSAKLDASAYYTLDDHLNARGSRIVAEALAETIRGLEPTIDEP